MFFSNGMFTGFLIYISLTVTSFTGNSVWKYLSVQVCFMLSYGLKPYCEEDCIEAANSSRAIKLKVQVTDDYS